MDMQEGRAESSALTLASGIVNQLRDQISRGIIPPGEKLRLEELRASFGVSLSPLREALSRLSAEGFVVMENQRGYRVAPVSEANLLEVMRLRAELEVMALREAIARGDSEWEGEVIAALYRVNKVEKAPAGRTQEWESTHRALHQKLLSACNMPLLMQTCMTLNDLSDRYRRVFLEDHPIDPTVSDEHARICHAAIERRADEACALLRSHIERTGANVLAALTKRRLQPASKNAKVLPKIKGRAKSGA